VGGRGAGTERGAEITGLGWRVERLFAPLRSHAMATAEIARVGGRYAV